MQFAQIYLFYFALVFCSDDRRRTPSPDSNTGDYFSHSSNETIRYVESELLELSVHSRCVLDAQMLERSYRFQTAQVSQIDLFVPEDVPTQSEQQRLAVLRPKRVFRVSHDLAPLPDLFVPEEPEEYRPTTPFDWPSRVPSPVPSLPGSIPDYFWPMTRKVYFGSPQIDWENGPELDKIPALEIFGRCCLVNCYLHMLHTNQTLRNFIEIHCDPQVEDIFYWLTKMFNFFDNPEQSIGIQEIQCSKPAGSVYSKNFTLIKALLAYFGQESENVADLVSDFTTFHSFLFRSLREEFEKKTEKHCPPPFLIDIVDGNFCQYHQDRLIIRNEYESSSFLINVFAPQCVEIQLFSAQLTSDIKIHPEIQRCLNAEYSEEFPSLTLLRSWPSVLSLRFNNANAYKFDQPVEHAPKDIPRVFNYPGGVYNLQAVILWLGDQVSEGSTYAAFIRRGPHWYFVKDKIAGYVTNENMDDFLFDNVDVSMCIYERKESQ